VPEDSGFAVGKVLQQLSQPFRQVEDQPVQFRHARQVRFTSSTASQDQSPQSIQEEQQTIAAYGLFVRAGFTGEIAPGIEAMLSPFNPSRSPDSLFSFDFFSCGRYALLLSGSGATPALD
jgi:hypothetical protein